MLLKASVAAVVITAGLLLCGCRGDQTRNRDATQQPGTAQRDARGGTTGTRPEGHDRAAAGSDDAPATARTGGGTSPVGTEGRGRGITGTGSTGRRTGDRTQR
jgi:hypothetical protein